MVGFWRFCRFKCLHTGLLWISSIKSKVDWRSSLVDAILNSWRKVTWTVGAVWLVESKQQLFDNMTNREDLRNQQQTQKQQQQLHFFDKHDQNNNDNDNNF